MKTKNLHITGSSTLMALFMGLSLTVIGQTRTNYSRGGTPANNSRAVTSSRSSNNERMVVTQRQTNNNARTSFRATDNRPATSSHNGNWNNNSGAKNNSGNGNAWKSDNHNNNGKNTYGNYNKGHNDNWGYNSHNDNWKSNGHNDHDNYGYYHHPKTYSVWKYPAPWEYSAHAVVFRHDYDDFFFYNNVFYRYSPYSGYYTVTYPSGIIFTYLPVGYSEVMVNGRIYYRYGDVFFEPTPAGYMIVNPPSGLYVTFNF